MSAPKRIQRKRTKGWRMPDGAIYVGRPSKWGNPFAVGYRTYFYSMGVWRAEDVLDRWAATDMFKQWMAHDRDHLVPDRPPPPSLTEVALNLRGHDLVCWCPLDQPCHADVLLELANGAD